jgi:hypothetical protein
VLEEAVSLVFVKNITPDMVDGKCSGCGRDGLTKKGKNGLWSRHNLHQQGTNNKITKSIAVPIILFNLLIKYPS